MKHTTRLLLLVAVLGLVGCSAKTTDAPETAPLSVEDWKAMPVDAKYTSETLERLKEGNPDLQTAEGWGKFSRTTLAQARRKDFPNGKR